MNLSISRQESFSRGELLLRTFFGWLYILIPHMFMLALFGIWSALLSFLAFWVILFTGRYPQNWFDYQVAFRTWNMRLSASLFNLIDGYPAIGLRGTSDSVVLAVPYSEDANRVTVLVRALFGMFYVLLPHSFLLLFRTIASYFIMAIAWWVVLFTGSYPESWHDFNVGTLRWQLRIDLYMSFLSDEYPRFSGRP